MMDEPKVPRLFRYMLACEQCRLSKSRIQVVVGRGPVTDVDYLFIGEAPGKNEDEQGKPFVGDAGKRMEELMFQAGLDEKRIYITNIVKCRPPENRPPASGEVKACSVHLQLQIKVIQPKLLVLIGNTALNYFFPNLKIMSVHGKLGPVKLGLPTYPIIHPAATLRHQAWSDLLLSDLRGLAETQQASAPVVIGPRVMR